MSVYSASTVSGLFWLPLASSGFAAVRCCSSFPEFPLNFEKLFHSARFEAGGETVEGHCSRKPNSDETARQSLRATFLAEPFTGTAAQGRWMLNVRFVQ
jgi:hypothetical protein